MKTASRRILTTCLAAAFFAAGSGFDALAQSLEEAKEGFAAADRALNEAYREARAALPGSVFEELREEQRVWLADRDERAAMAARWDNQTEEGQEESDPGYWGHLEGLSQERLTVVQAWARDGTFEKEWEGVWVDGGGGTLRIAEGDAGELLFHIEVVRGPTYHLGEIGGVARSLRSTARFSTRIDGEEEETWITFVCEGRGLRVIGENTSYFHGARAYFDGDYLRHRELDEDDRERLREGFEQP